MDSCGFTKGAMVTSDKENVYSYQVSNKDGITAYISWAVDQDRYMASDGTEIIVPTTAEYVYYNGDSVVWADNASYKPEAGYEQIN